MKIASFSLTHSLSLNSFPCGISTAGQTPYVNTYCKDLQLPSYLLRKQKLPFNGSQNGGSQIWKTVKPPTFSWALKVNSDVQRLVRTEVVFAQVSVECKRNSTYENICTLFVLTFIFLFAAQLLKTEIGHYPYFPSSPSTHTSNQSPIHTVQQLSNFSILPNPLEDLIKHRLLCSSLKSFWERF